MRNWRRNIGHCLLRAAMVGGVLVVSLFPIPAFSQSQSGKASFYPKRATGTLTANGERLHHDSMTCAHRSYPFGTLLRVTNSVNGKQVVVRVNDRGPFRKGRIIDLSWGAAKAIGMISQGIVPVVVEKIREPNIPYKPDDDDIELPKFEFELADIAPTGITPIWQQDEVKIDARKVQRSMRRTVALSARDTMRAKPALPASASVRTVATGRKPASSAAKGQQVAAPAAQPKDVLDHINENPHGAKAYLKREGRK